MARLASHARPTVSLLLKRATDAAHRRAERRIDRVAPIDTPAGYRRFLRGMRALHCAHAGRIDAASRLAGLAPRSATLIAALDADLAEAPGETARGPAAATECWGVGYVFEGSALGAAVLLRRAPTGTRRYLQASADGVGPRWRCFRAALDRTSEPHEAMIAAARACFRAVLEEFSDEHPIDLEARSRGGHPKL